MIYYHPRYFRHNCDEHGNTCVVELRGDGRLVVRCVECNDKLVLIRPDQGETS
jgi:hypothetical protein